VPAGAPLLREWTLVCEARDFSACLSAWELPGQHGTPDADRLFETVWTLSPSAVRDGPVQGGTHVGGGGRSVGPRRDEEVIPGELPDEADPVSGE
jgi:hypothetical protein